MTDKKEEQAQEVQQDDKQEGPRTLQDLTLAELKALAYDHVLLIQDAQIKLRTIEAEIQKRGQG